MRYRAFLSYSQRDRKTARLLHRALETYRVPAGVDAPVGPDRRLGRFFRDDDEMGASQSLGAALEGALDDAENLIVLCTPSASRSKWVDAEVRRFKRRGSARVFAVIADGEPNAADPARECFPPSLKVKVDRDGNPTGEPDEPRAPDLRREGLPRVRAQLAAGLLGIPFDQLWQRDRRRARRTRLVAGAAALLVAAGLAVLAWGWLNVRAAARRDAADQGVAAARGASADGRIGEALNRLAPFLADRDTRQRVEEPLRALLGWIPDPYASVRHAGLTIGRLRDATVLLDPGKGVYDVSDVGLELQRLIRSRDGRRLVAVGDQRVAVFDLATGQRLTQADNEGVEWVGHTFEAPSGLLVVTGAVLGPTNGSVVPYLLSISADGKTMRREQIRAPMFWGSAVAVTPPCDALLVAAEGELVDLATPVVWRTESRALTAAGLGQPVALAPFQPAGESGTAELTAQASGGSAFETRDAFVGEAKANPFVAAGCAAPGSDDGFAAGSLRLKGAQVVALEPVLTFEAAGRWTPAPAGAGDPPSSPSYLPDCTEARPCPVIGGRTDQPFVRDELPATAADEIGPPPAPRWPGRAAAGAAAATSRAPIYFEHRVYNSGHQLTVCRPRGGRDACLNVTALGEDQRELPFLRSPDGRYLFWPFGGSVYDLETLQPLTAARAIPETEGPAFDFDVDRPALTLALDGRLVSFVAGPDGKTWARRDAQRASPHFGLLAAAAGEPPLQALASLGGRHYLAVRRDGVMARLDAESGRELWRLTAAGLGEVGGVQLDPDRTHALVLGKGAWRLFRLADGFPLSGLLAPPPALAQPERLAGCKPAGALGPAGELAARCGAARFAWRPQAFRGAVEPRLDRLTCAADVKGSALETIRRCYVHRSTE